ncbi:MAG: peptidoglycan-binding protein [Eubacterium sp.]|nr:peptidoglycan-binding protein [Eubacterium sp.]
MQNRKKILVAVLCIGLLTPYSISSAHGHQGGHHNNTNSAKYHYNCGGHRYPAHLHEDGACPYASSKKCPTCYRTSTIKKVQKKLNKLGYRCGKTGCYDAKTKSAICKFQKKKCIAVNGKINQTLLKKMNIAHK